MRTSHLAILVALIGGVWVTTGVAQSPNPFGIPTAEVPNPGEAIQAVPGLRAQGWPAQGRSEVLARHGVVATSDPLAAQAGLEMLQRGPQVPLVGGLDAEGDVILRRLRGGRSGEGEQQERDDGASH